MQLFDKVKSRGKRADESKDGQEVDQYSGMPVDGEHKALKLKLTSFKKPHMRSWHLCWFGFFTSFLSTFAPAALLFVIRENLSLTGDEITNAGIAAICGTLGARVMMGVVCDNVGPRLGMSFVLLLSSSCIFGMALANTPLQFALLRFGIGFGISTFVACQYWSSCMFNVRIVGVANATAGGWGNVGGGFTQLIMPVIYNGLTSIHPDFIAWRWAMFIPGFCHILASIGILFFSTDLPDGNFATLKKSGQKQNDSGGARVFLRAVYNYRTWCLAAAYAMSFGIELTINNIITPYIFDNFDKSITVSGVVGSMFGIMNLFSRSLGGLASDFAAQRFGMRGRIWSLFLLQVCQGCFCIGLGLADNTFPGTVALIIVFSLFVQSCEGATYAIVPFVSKRALGAVSGIVGAGGDFGSVLTQVIFFRFGSTETNMGIVYMGIMIVCASVVAVPIYFPAWGGMFFPAKKGATEEDYYLADYNEEEKASGLCDPAIQFAQESKSQRAASERPDELSTSKHGRDGSPSRHDNMLYDKSGAQGNKDLGIAEPSV